MQRLGVYGAPVSAISLHGDDDCFYGQGSFLLHCKGVDKKHQPVVLFPSTIHGIRKSCRSAELLIVFGGRHLAFFHAPRNAVLSIDHETSLHSDNNNNNNQHYLTLPDWIWDCVCEKKTNKKDDASDTHHHTIMVALAHGTVQLWNMEYSSEMMMMNDDESVSTNIRLQRTHQVSMCQSSLVQTVSIIISNDQQNKVAMAQDGAIHIGKFPKMDLTPPSLCSIPVPMAGTMHALRFNDTGTRLASVSNDRSVRLYEFFKEEWHVQWTAWGHAARVWDVAFVLHHVVSTGGDNTIRLWNAQTGTALYVWNTLRCMRSLDTFHSSIAAGGNDGSIVLYNVHDIVGPSSTNHQATTTVVDDAPNRRRYAVPSDDDHHDHVSSHWQTLKELQRQSEQTQPSTDTSCDSTISKKQKKTIKQVLVGACICSVRDRLSIAVATRQGAFYLLDLTSGNWSRRADWEESSNATHGCCMTVHPQFPIAAIGTTRGSIIIVRFDDDDDDDDAPVSTHKTTLHAAQHRSVQALEWINSTTLVTYHIHTVIIWKFVSSQLELADLSHNHSMRVLETKTKGMVICGAFHQERQLFAAGDTRGNLVLFDLGGSSTEEVMEPISSLSYCHRKEHINGLVWVNKNIILSVGNDGCIAETRVTAEGKLEALLSVPTGQLTGITHIFMHARHHLSQTTDSNVNKSTEAARFDDISIAGYMGNRFSLLDATSGYEFANVNTSGRHRSLEIYTPTGFPQKSLMVVRESRIDGGTDLIVSTFGVDMNETNGTDRDNQPSTTITCTHGLPLHNDSIFGLCLFPLKTVSGQVALVCASEDCFITISIFQNETLTKVKRLPPMVSGVRAVCHSSSKMGRNLLALGGGRLEIMFYIVDSNHQEDDLFPNISFLGCGAPTEKQIVDQRINAIKAVFLSGTGDEAKHLVVTGDSEGSCCMYMVAESRSKRTLGYNFFCSDRPILSLDLWKDGLDIFIVAGTTNGFVYIFEVSEKLLRDRELKMSQLCPIASYRGHSMGTNAIAARLIEEPLNKNNMKILKIASVGDDQAICCCDIRVKDSSGHVSVISQTVKREASLSALKGIEWTSDQTFVTVGYDQRVVQWTTFDGISSLSVAPVSIGDVNCLGMCKGPRGSIIAIGGAGVELICIEDDCVKC